MSVLAVINTAFSWLWAVILISLWCGYFKEWREKRRAQRKLWLIVKANGTLMQIGDVKICGQPRSLPAIFLREEDAVTVLESATEAGFTGLRIVNNRVFMK